MARDEETREGIDSEKDSEEEPVFDVGQDTKVEEPFEYDEEAVNLVTEFKEHPEGRAALKRIGNVCLDDFEQAWKAQEKFREEMAKTWKLFTGQLDPKRAELQHMSNAHVPLLMENTIRMVYRQNYELFGNWTNVFGVTPIGPDDEDTAKLLTLHGNWQIRKRIPDFKRELGHRGLLIYDLFGDLSVHSYWDPERQYNRHEVLTANEFVTANAHVSTMPDYSDVPWVAKLLFMSAPRMRKMDGAWEDVATTLKAVPPAWDESLASENLREAVDRGQGVDSTEYLKGEYELLQWEGWLNLPDQDRDRYCQAIIDRQTKTVLSLRVHERMDPYDKRRFEFETQQKEQWLAAVQEAQAFEQERQATVQAALAAGAEADPMSDAPAAMVMQARQIEQMPPPEVPPMPEWMGNDPEAEPRPPAFVPIRLFTHFVNIEPLMGVLGIGTGKIHADQNRAANIGLQAFADQAMMANFGNWLHTGDLELPKPFIVEPFKFHKITGSAIDLTKQLVPLNTNQANPQLLDLVRLMSEFGGKVTNTPEVLSGEPGKSGETAQGLIARIEQATKMLSVPTGKYADGLSHVLVNNGRINAMMLDDAEFFSVNNHDPRLGEMGRQFISVGKDLYDRPYDVEISADLKFTSTSQRISEADALVQLPQAVPALQGNLAFQYETVKKSLEARNRFDLIALLGAPPPVPQMFGMPSIPPVQPPPGAPPSPQAPGGGGPNPGPPQGAPPQGQ